MNSTLRKKTMKIIPVYNENTKYHFVSKDYLKPYLLDEDGTDN